MHHDAHASPRPAAQPPRDGARRGRGRVRAIARAAGRGCSRPNCDVPAAATLVFSYHDRVARLVDLLDEVEPQAYDLCPTHADRTRPPVGWELTDTRPPPSDAPRRLDDDATVQVLAAALRGETPATRMDVVEGGRVDEPTPEVAAGAETEADGEDPDDDPLRAALEELQRIAAPDDDVAGVAATPLRPPPPPPPTSGVVPDGPLPPPPPGYDPPSPTLW